MKITVWTEAVKLSDALSNRLSAITNTSNKVVKGVSIKNNTSGSTLYIESNWITSTVDNWYPIWYEGSYHFEEAQLSDISLISASWDIDVRILFTD